MSEEMVNHPNHYNKHKMECIDEMIIMFGKQAVFDFCICNAYKYRSRAPYKNNTEEDNNKADWYLQKAKELDFEIDKKKNKAGFEVYSLVENKLHDV